MYLSYYTAVTRQFFRVLFLDISVNFEIAEEAQRSANS